MNTTHIYMILLLMEICQHNINVGYYQQQNYSISRIKQVNEITKILSAVFCNKIIVLL